MLNTSKPTTVLKEVFSPLSNWSHSLLNKWKRCTLSRRVCPAICMQTAISTNLRSLTWGAPFSWEITASIALTLSASSAYAKTESDLSCLGSRTESSIPQTMARSKDSSKIDTMNRRRKLRTKSLQQGLIQCQLVASLWFIRQMMLKAMWSLLRCTTLAATRFHPWSQKRTCSACRCATLTRVSSFYTVTKS